MENSINYLYDLIMKYYSGINFISHGSLCDYDSVIKKRFANYYGIQFNYSGRFAVSIDNGPERIVDGPHALLTSPGPLFCYGAPAGESRHHSHLCFNGPRVKRFISEGLLPRRQMPLFKIRRGEKFMQMFNELTGYLKLGPPGHDYAVHLLEGLLLELHESEKPLERDTFLTNPIRQLANKIRIKPEQNWDFALEASDLNISYSHFRRLFKEVMHCPPGHFVNLCRLEKGAMLLINSSLTITEVADAIGIPDQHYFSRLFKKQFQLPPATYRKEFSA